MRSAHPAGKKKARAFWKNVYDHIIYVFAWVTGWPLALLCFRTKRVYQPGAPRRLPPGSILTCNHVCFKDPLTLLCVFFPRRIRFLCSTAVMEEMPFLRWALPKMGCIEIDKDNFDISCIFSLVEIIRKKGVVGIFPEGALHGEEVPAPFKEGTAMIAIKTGAPVIPVYMKPAQKWYQRRLVVVGAPMQAEKKGPLPTRGYVKEFSEKMFGKTMELQQVAEQMESGK